MKANLLECDCRKQERDNMADVYNIAQQNLNLNQVGNLDCHSIEICNEIALNSDLTIAIKLIKVHCDSLIR